ncbi:MAG: hypothetical protein ACJAYY_001932 [Paraglaciecola sp.]|jgi:hypothetical protein
MNTHADKTQENKNESIASDTSQKQGSDKATFQFVDNRPEVVAQRKLQEMANNSQQVSQLKVFQDIANNSPQTKQVAQLQPMATESASEQQQPTQKEENNTGLPDNLKTGMENLSGMSLGDVKVHRNSDKPAQLKAHAYAQGTDIHLGPGQEKHLPHEAWHVVQQKQGRVKPTTQLKGKVNVNDDAGLEKEADVMGAKALLHQPNNDKKIIKSSSSDSIKPIQRQVPEMKEGEILDDNSDNENDNKGLLQQGGNESEDSDKRGALNPSVTRQTKNLMELLRTQRRQVIALTKLLNKGKKASAVKDIGAGILKIAVTVASSAIGIPGLGELGGEGLVSGLEGGLEATAEYASLAATKKVTGIGADVGTGESAKAQAESAKVKDDERLMADVNTKTGVLKSKFNPSVRKGAGKLSRKGLSKMSEDGVKKTAGKALKGGGKAGFAGIKMVLTPLIQIGTGLRTIAISKETWRDSKRGHAEIALEILSTIEQQRDVAKAFVGKFENMGELEHQVSKGTLGMFRAKKDTLNKEIDKTMRVIQECKPCIDIYVTGSKSNDQEEGDPNV